MKTLIIFCHIPKTAGSSLKAIGATNCEKNVDFYKAFNPRNTKAGDWISNFNDLQSGDSKQGKILLSGHFGFGIDLFLKHSKFHYLTVLRNPIDRILSHYFFMKRQCVPVVKDMSLLEFSLSDKYVTTDNMHTRFLSGSGWQSYNTDYLEVFGIESDIKYGECNEEMLVRAKHNLMNHFTYGLQEQMEKSLKLFSYNFNWTISNRMLNVGKNVLRSTDLDPKTAKILTDKNKFDLVLYDFAVKNFLLQFENQTL